MIFNFGLTEKSIENNKNQVCDLQSVVEKIDSKIETVRRGLNTKIDELEKVVKSQRQDLRSEIHRVEINQQQDMVKLQFDNKIIQESLGSIKEI